MLGREAFPARNGASCRETDFSAGQGISSRIFAENGIFEEKFRIFRGVRLRVALQIFFRVENAAEPPVVHRVAAEIETVRGREAHRFLSRRPEAQAVLPALEALVLLDDPGSDGPLFFLAR